MPPLTNRYYTRIERGGDDVNKLIELAHKIKLLRKIDFSSPEPETVSLFVNLLSVLPLFLVESPGKCVELHELSSHNLNLEQIWNFPWM